MKLLEFPHSHYCEKARWALDFKNIPFTSMAIMPGVHLWTVRRYAPGTSVPVLLSDDQVIQARIECDRTLDEVAEKLNGKSYFFGDQFSRADLTVSSLLSFLVMPRQHPFPWPAIPDSDIKTFQDSYKDHPLCVWVSKTYVSHRLRKPER